MTKYIFGYIYKFIRYLYISLIAEDLSEIEYKKYKIKATCKNEKNNIEFILDKFTWLNEIEIVEYLLDEKKTLKGILLSEIVKIEAEPIETEYLYIYKRYKPFFIHLTKEQLEKKKSNHLEKIYKEKINFKL